MMKLKRVVLVTSVCMALHVAASENTLNRKTSFSDTNNTTSNTVQQIPKNSQGSTILTTFRYGFGKWIAGETAAGVYFKMNEDGTLQGDVEKNPTQAINRLNDATKERFNHPKRTLTDPINQKKIYEIFTIAETLKSETGRDFGVTKIVADEYNPLQEKALQEITLHHAMNIEPQLRQARDNAIEVAKTIYQAEMTEILTFAAQTATSKRYLHERAQNTSALDLQDAKHYQKISTYLTLLESIRSTQSSNVVQKSNGK